MQFLRAAILAVIVAGSTAGAIWSVDRQFARHPPVERFELESKAAATLPSQHSIVFPSRINEPMLRWSIAEKLQTKPEIVLFGSSHGLEVSSENVGRRRLINLSISGAMLSDHLISAEILARREKRARVWLVMVDAWLFNPDVDFQNWHARPHEIARIESNLSKLSDPPLTLLFGPRVDFFLSGKQKPQYSLDPLFRGFDRFIRRYFDNVVIPDHDFQATIMTPDGALQPSSDKQQITPEEVRSLALRQYAYCSNAGCNFFNRMEVGSFSCSRPTIPRSIAKSSPIPKTD
jgi:hypothetical protein